MRLTPCFRKKLLRIGKWMLPLAVISSFVLAPSPAAAAMHMLVWLAAYLGICLTWWSITQFRRARRLS